MLHVASISQAELLSHSNIKQHFRVHPGRDSVCQSWSPSESESVRVGVGCVIVRRLRHRQSRWWSDVTLSPCYLSLGFRPAVNPFQSSRFYIKTEAVPWQWSCRPVISGCTVPVKLSSSFSRQVPAHPTKAQLISSIKFGSVLVAVIVQSTESHQRFQLNSGCCKVAVIIQSSEIQLSSGCCKVAVIVQSSSCHQTSSSCWKTKLILPPKPKISAFCCFREREILQTQQLLLCCYGKRIQ